MNYKYFVQLIALILLGFAAVGNPAKQDQPPLHAGTYLEYDSGATVDNQAVTYHDRPVFRSNWPSKKTSTIRSRFRAVSLIQLTPSDSNQLVGSTCSTQIGKGTSGINTGHLPPFYYIFLFRLTPF